MTNGVAVYPNHCPHQRATSVVCAESAQSNLMTSSYFFRPVRWVGTEVSTCDLLVLIISSVSTCELVVRVIGSAVLHV